MADNNDKLSLHIGSKNMTTMTSGFVDVSATPSINTKLTLNRQTIVGIGNGENGPAAITGVGITGGTGGQATAGGKWGHKVISDVWNSSYPCMMSGAYC
jgi:hypothetical protein